MKFSVRRWFVDSCAVCVPAATACTVCLLGDDIKQLLYDTNILPQMLDVNVRHSNESCCSPQCLQVTNAFVPVGRSYLTTFPAWWLRGGDIIVQMLVSHRSPFARATIRLTNFKLIVHMRCSLPNRDNLVCSVLTVVVLVRSNTRMCLLPFLAVRILMIVFSFFHAGLDYLPLWQVYNLTHFHELNNTEEFTGALFPLVAP